MMSISYTFVFSFSLQAVEMLKSCIQRIFEMTKSNSGSPIRALSKALSYLKILSTPAEKTKNDLLSVPMGVSGLRSSGPSVASNTPIEVGSSSEDGPNQDDIYFRLLFPILFGLYEVVMTCDLEVRTRGLTYLFETIKLYGDGFSRDAWEVITKGVLFPIFDDLKLSRQEHTKFDNKEDMSVWLSTTLIQALRLFVDLFTSKLDQLSFCIDGLLDLLIICMTQGTWYHFNRFKIKIFSYLNYRKRNPCKNRLNLLYSIY
jgi:brefeldin A-inhibited guanine nucleotide-exchange protein